MAVCSQSGKAVVYFIGSTAKLEVMSLKPPILFTSFLPGYPELTGYEGEAGPGMGSFPVFPANKNRFFQLGIFSVIRTVGQVVYLDIRFNPRFSGCHFPSRL